MTLTTKRGLVLVTLLVSLLLPASTTLAANPKVQYKAQSRQKVYKKVTYAKKAYSNEKCSCVLYAKRVSGINVGSIGYAKNHPINSRTPKVGSVMVMHSGWTGHVGVVTSVNGNSVTITEANWQPCKSSSRTLQLNDRSIRGYYTT